MLNDRLRALVLAHDPSAPGGVNNFLRIMRRRYRSRVDATRFSNGPRKGEQSRLSKLTRMLGDYVRFIVVVGRRSFDIFHINPSMDLSSTPRELLFGLIFLAIRPHSSLLIFYRGWDWSAFNKIQKNAILKALFRYTNRRASKILVLSSDFAEALAELGVDARKVDCTTTMFEGELLRPALRQFCAQPETILFLSRFLPAKGGETVLRAFQAVLGYYPRARLIMAGDGPDRQRLEQIALNLSLENAVEFTGYVGGPRKMRLLAEASIFVLPTSHPEGMPNAILEAMAAGQVVITTAVGGVRSVVEDGLNGTVIPPNDEGALQRAILMYLQNPALTKAVSDANTQKAWSTWESQIVANSIADQYFSVRSST